MSIKTLALPLFLTAFLGGCIQTTEPEPAPVIGEDGKEVLTEEVISEDDLNA